MEELKIWKHSGFIIHNLIAHPLLCFKTKWADKFHDWTADKMK